jgi:hypothetical protein
MTRYLAKMLLTALVIAPALPAPGFTQSVDRSQSAAGTASSPRTTFQMQEIAPGQALSIVIDHSFFGVAYFMSEPDGLHLVATIRGTWGPSVRFVTTLAPDQTATVSVPRQVGEESIEVSFLRQGERLVVKAPAHIGN